MFNKTYELSLSRNYVSRWGLLEAIREFLQNAIDSESPFVYQFVHHPDDTYTLILDSEFTVLQPATLLLGTTSKTDSQDAIGSFGEGYKIAILVLTRLKIPLTILNGDKQWIPSFKYCKKFEEELLVITEENINFKHKGLSISIGGLTEEDVEKIRESCLLMQTYIGQVYNTKYGQILLEKPGKLYVGSLYICETELKYGYNIDPQYITLERDRQTVNSWDLKDTTKKIWIATELYDDIAKLIEEEIPDLEYVYYNSPELVKEACYKLFKERNPGAIAAQNQEELKTLVSRGMEKVVVIGRTYYSQVTNSPSAIIERPTYSPEYKVQEYLKHWLETNKKHMRRHAIIAFNEILEEAINWKYKI